MLLYSFDKGNKSDLQFFVDHLKHKNNFGFELEQEQVLFAENLVIDKRSSSVSVTWKSCEKYAGTDESLSLFAVLANKTITGRLITDRLTILLPIVKWDEEALEFRALKPHHWYEPYIIASLPVASAAHE
jgi:hypothetical protein